MYFRDWALILASIHFLCVGSVMADQRLLVEAEQVEFDQTTQLSNYMGNVQVLWKDISLKADRLEVRHNGKRVSTIHAWGKPARFVKILQNGESDEATASQIYYDVARRQILFTGAVEARNQGASMRGERLSYDLADGRMQAEGGADEGKRVRIEIETESVQ